MAKRVQLIRHTTVNADLFIGREGEVTVDLDRAEFRLHDGTTAGGVRLLNKTQLDTAYFARNDNKLLVSTNEVVVNDAAGAVDLRVETDTITDALLVDASADKIITNAPIDFKVSGAVDFTIAANLLTVPAGSTLDVSAGTLTLADDQISGNKVEGGTIAAVTITTLGTTTVNAGTLNTTNLAATGTLRAGVAIPSDSIHTINTASGSKYVLNVFTSVASAPFGLFIRYTGSAPNGTGNEFITCSDSSTLRFAVRSNGDAENVTGTFGAISDRRFKQDFIAASAQWDDVKALSALMCKFRIASEVALNDNAPYLLGAVAQDVLLVSPGLVSESGEGENAKYGLKYSIMFMKGFKAVGELLAWADDAVKPALADHELRIAALEAA